MNEADFEEMDDDYFEAYVRFFFAPVKKPFYCPYCQIVIEPDEFGIYSHYEHIKHPPGFRQELYKVMH